MLVWGDTYAIYKIEGFWMFKSDRFHLLYEFGRVRFVAVVVVSVVVLTDTELAT